MGKKLFFYCVSYETSSTNQKKDSLDMDFLIANQTPLNIDLQKEKLEWYYNQNKIPYSEIVITESKELSEKEYYIRTNYI